MADTWKELRPELNLSDEEKSIIEFEKDLIRTMIEIRESQGLSQAQLAKVCNVKQPVIARMEKDIHSPQVDSLLKILVPMGFTLKIEPLKIK